MSDARPWYREPETFIALAALVVSLSAVGVGLYEASLQRAHDRAEVWPHVELGTLVSPAGASLSVANGGIGPAIIKSVAVAVDGTPRQDWGGVLTAILGARPSAFNTSTIVDHALRAGDQVTVVSIGKNDMPPEFWKAAARISVSICYSSVFGDSWVLSDTRLGGTSKWVPVAVCPRQGQNVDF